MAKNTFARRGGCDVEGWRRRPSRGPLGKGTTTAATQDSFFLHALFGAHHAVHPHALLGGGPPPLLTHMAFAHHALLL